MCKKIKDIVERTYLASIYRRIRDDRKFLKRQFKQTPWGYKFTGNTDMQRGVFEKDEIALIEQHLDSADIFVDVGANIGYFSCFAMSKGRQVIAFEPIEENLKYLYSNFMENGWLDGAEIYPVGLSDKPGLVPIYGSGTGASLLQGWSGISKNWARTLPVFTLDNFLTAKRFEGKEMFIKIDVEGIEFPVLRGAVATLQKQPRPKWLVEITLAEHRQGDRNKHFLETFELFWGNGYETIDMKGESIARQEIVEYSKTGIKKEWISGNYLFV
jgi:FkbM family methyltransferase